LDLKEKENYFRPKVKEKGKLTNKKFTFLSN